LTGRVISQSVFRGGNEIELKNVVASVRLGPTVKDKVFYANVPVNIQAAIEERYTKKVKPMTLAKKHHHELVDVAKELLRLHFTRPKMREVMEGLLSEMVVSKKWSQDRADKVFERLRADFAPRYRFKASIKLEPMQEGKAPRLLIADGDEGQVMALLTAHVVETILFRLFERNSIKHVSKSEAIARAVKTLAHTRKDGRRVPCSVIENDGSAWDMCCSSQLRDLTENVVFYHVVEYILDTYVGSTEGAWAKKHLEACKETVLRLEVKNRTYDGADGSLKKKIIRLTLDAVRRSGHRLTSGANWLLNFICTVWVFYGKNAWKFANPEVQCAKDIDDVLRWLRFVLEGDDNDSTVSPRVSKDYVSRIEDRWRSLGHLPKLFMREPGSRTEFTGWHICVDEYGPIEGTQIPDLPRLLTGIVLSSSTAVREAAATGDMAAVCGVAYGTLLSGAAALCERLPTPAHMLLRWAREWKARAPGARVDPVYDRDQLMKLGRTVRHYQPHPWNTAQEAIAGVLHVGDPLCTEERIEASISHASSIGGEAELIVRHGLASFDDWTRFCAGSKVVSIDTPCCEYRKILPDGWAT